MNRIRSVHINRWSITFVLVLLPFFLLAQRQVSGIVINAANGTPVEGCSVFLAHTSIGTSSSGDGRFVLNNVPSGKYELVFSSIGYDTKVVSIEENGVTANLTIELKIRARELPNVILEPYEEGDWSKWGQLFLVHFIGTTRNSFSCTLLNKEVVRFRYYKRSQRLIAYSEKPLLVQNLALGYRIRYELESFEIDFAKNAGYFSGHPLFIPIDTNAKAVIEKWEQNRQAVYRGSILHFMRSLYQNRLYKEGFEVTNVIRPKNLEKERVRELFPDKKTIRKQPGLPDDTIRYYQRIMKQEDYGPSIVREIQADSIVSREGETAVVSFDGYLVVNYTKGDGETAFPAKGMQGIREVKIPPQVSYAVLVNKEPIRISPNGHYQDPRSFLTSGYWAWFEKLANEVPIDFKVK